MEGTGGFEIICTVPRSVSSARAGHPVYTYNNIVARAHGVYVLRSSSVLPGDGGRIPKMYAIFVFIFFFPLPGVLYFYLFFMCFFFFPFGRRGLQTRSLCRSVGRVGDVRVRNPSAVIRGVETRPYRRNQTNTALSGDSSGHKRRREGLP